MTNNILKVLMIIFALFTLSMSISWIVTLFIKYSKSIDVWFLQHWELISKISLFCVIIIVLFLTMIGIGR